MFQGELYWKPWVGIFSAQSVYLLFFVFKVGKKYIHMSFNQILFKGLLKNLVIDLLVFTKCCVHKNKDYENEMENICDLTFELIIIIKLLIRLLVLSFSSSNTLQSTLFYCNPVFQEPYLFSDKNWL